MFYSMVSPKVPVVGCRFRVKNTTENSTELDFQKNLVLFQIFVKST
jgi:hypothetical protein